MRRGFGSHLWVGLDLGSYSVKLYAVAPGGGARTAEATLRATDAPDGAPSPAVQQRAIGACLQQAGLSAGAIRGVTTGVSGPDVIVKQVQLPLMDDEEVGPALRFEARKHLPFDPHEMVIDFQVIGRLPSERKLDVLLAAVGQQRLERHLAPLRALGIEPDIVDATPLALANAALTGITGDREVRIVLDLGHEASTLSIYQRGEIYFSRRIAFGGRAITRAISEASRIPLEEAEEWKLAAGGPSPTHLLDWDSPEMKAVLEVLRRELVDELRRSFVFYQTQARLHDPFELYLCGGTAQMPLIAERIGELLGSSAEVFEPPAESSGQRRAPGGPQFAQAYGLSLRVR